MNKTIKLQLIALWVVFFLIISCFKSNEKNTVIPSPGFYDETISGIDMIYAKSGLVDSIIIPADSLSLFKEWYMDKIEVIDENTAIVFNNKLETEFRYLIEKNNENISLIFDSGFHPIVGEVKIEEKFDLIKIQNRYRHTYYRTIFYNKNLRYVLFSKIYEINLDSIRSTLEKGDTLKYGKIYGEYNF